MITWAWGIPLLLQCDRTFRFIPLIKSVLSEIQRRLPTRLLFRHYKSYVNHNGLFDKETEAEAETESS